MERLLRLWLCSLTLILLAPAPADAQAGAAPHGLSPEELLLARIKVHASQTLNRLPNYTCLQTIERSRRRASSKRFELVDVIRLEVAFVEGKELFAWPGEAQFLERDLRELAPGGAIGNGDFALHARSVFLSHGPQFVRKGQETLDGRRTVRFDFSVGILDSGYRIRIDPHEEIVPYEGSFWVDAQSLDLLKLEIRALDIPPELALTEAVTTITYSRSDIGGRQFNLPAETRLRLVDSRGGASDNLTRYSRCRQYQGESVVRFDDPEADPREETPDVAVRHEKLPAKVTLEAELIDDVEFAQAAIGDRITMRLVKDAKYAKRIVLPKGAILKGRLTRLRRHKTPVEHTEVGIRLTAAESPGVIASLRAILIHTGWFPRLLEQVKRPTALTAARPTSTYRVMVNETPQDYGLIFMRGANLPKGMRMSWRTQPWPEWEQPE